LKAVEPEDESIFDEYKVEIVSVPCAVGYDKKCFFPVVAVVEDAEMIPLY
jgi:hypothetical protein